MIFNRLFYFERDHHIERQLVIIQFLGKTGEGSGIDHAAGSGFPQIIAAAGPLIQDFYRPQRAVTGNYEGNEYPPLRGLPVIFVSGPAYFLRHNYPGK